MSVDWFAVVVPGLPLAALAFFVVSLVRYRRLKKQPDAAPEAMARRKLLLAVAAALAGVVWVIFLTFFILMYLAVSSM